MNKEYITWADIDAMVEKLVADIQASGMRYNMIVGLARGGLVPGVMISHRLDIPLLSIDPKTQSGPAQTARTLVVDEINDSGNTLKRFLGENTAAHTAVLFEKKSSVFASTYAARIIEPDAPWIVMPWEKD